MTIVTYITIYIENSNHKKPHAHKKDRVKYTNIKKTILFINQIKIK